MKTLIFVITGFEENIATFIVGGIRFLIACINYIFTGKGDFGIPFDLSALHATAVRSAFVLISLGGIWMIIRYYYRQKRAGRMETVEILLSRDDTAEPFEVMGFFDSCYGALLPKYFGWLTGRDYFVWEVEKNKEGIHFYLSASKGLNGIQSRLQATYQNIRFEPVETKSWEQAYGEQLRLARKWFYPLRSLRNYQSSITESLVNVLDNADGRVKLQFVLVPKGLRFQKLLRKMQEKYEITEREVSLEDPADPGMGYLQDSELKSNLEMTGKGIFGVDIRVVAEDAADIPRVAGCLSEAGGQNRIVRPNFFQMLIYRIFEKLWWKWFNAGIPSVLLFRRIIVSSFHLATLIHLPSVRVKVSGLKRTGTRRAPAVLDCPRDEECAIVRDERGPVSILEQDRKYNILLLGGQGTGKSTTMENIIRIDAKNNNKAMVILDPNNDLAVKSLGLIPPNRDVIYLDIAGDCPYGINPFAADAGPDLVVDGVISSFKRYWGAGAIGPRSEEFLANSMYALLDVGGKITFSNVEAMLTDPGFRSKVMKNVKDVYQGRYWNTTFERMEENQRFLEEALAAPRNKLGRLLSREILRKVLCHPKPLNISQVIQDKKILIVNLAKGMLGEENSGLMGIFILNMIWQEIQRQLVLNKDARVPVSIVVDEAHNMMSETFEKLLAEGRKVGAQSTIAYQFRGQVRDSVLFDAIATLVQNIFLFRTQELEDAEYYAKMFMRLYSNMIQVSDEVQDRLNFGPDDITSLPDFHAITRLVVKGKVQPAFLAETIPTDGFYRPDWAEIHLARQQEMMAGVSFEEEADNTVTSLKDTPPPSLETNEKAKESISFLESLGKKVDDMKQIEKIIEAEKVETEIAEKAAMLTLEQIEKGKVRNPYGLYRKILRDKKRGA